MTSTALGRDDVVAMLALGAPLAVRLHADGAEPALQRLLLLATAFGVAYAWALLFARAGRRPIGAGLPAFAMTFVLMLPGPVAWGSAVIALSFGAVFGREIFGGKAILPPAVVGLAFALFSFPAGGFEARGVFTLPSDPLLALSCLAGAALLLAKGSLAWQVAAGAVAGAVATGLALGSARWFEHLQLGTFAAGILFLAAAPESAVGTRAARWLHGLLVGALVVVIRHARPDQPDGVVFAVLLGGLFAPLIDRALAWNGRHG